MNDSDDSNTGSLPPRTFSLAPDPQSQLPVGHPFQNVSQASQSHQVISITHYLLPFPLKCTPVPEFQVSEDVTQTRHLILWEYL